MEDVADFRVRSATSPGKPNHARPAISGVITPAAIGPEYFREAFEVLKAAAGGPPDRAKMAEVMRRHGLTPAP